VQEVDVVNGAHVGYLYPPGTFRGPCGVAASKRYTAVTFEDHCVRLLEVATGAVVWTVDSYQHLTAPSQHSLDFSSVLGLPPPQPRLTTAPFLRPVAAAFTADGQRLAVLSRDGFYVVELALDSGIPVAFTRFTSGFCADALECAQGWVLAGSSVECWSRDGEEHRSTLQPHRPHITVPAMALDSDLGLVLLVTTFGRGHSLEVMPTRLRRCLRAFSSLLSPSQSLCPTGAEVPHGHTTTTTVFSGASNQQSVSE
jgi:hypothetical protein